MRHPIQLSTCNATTRIDGEPFAYVAITALCDDGTIWSTDAEGEWYQVSAVPQTKLAHNPLCKCMECAPENWPGYKLSDYDDLPNDLVL